MLEIKIRIRKIHRLQSVISHLAVGSVEMLNKGWLMKGGLIIETIGSSKAEVHPLRNSPGMFLRDDTGLWSVSIVRNSPLRDWKRRRSFKNSLGWAKGMKVQLQSTFRKLGNGCAWNVGTSGRGEGMGMRARAGRWGKGQDSEKAWTWTFYSLLHTQYKQCLIFSRSWMSNCWVNKSIDEWIDRWSKYYAEAI